ncbi:MAG: hypothetical protein Q8R34_02410 [bacterium]|nr:hypothetical protein [bacterium]
MAWQTFGFENIKKYFERAVGEDSTEHSYLFSGQEMIGKKTFALELASHIQGSPVNRAALYMDPDLLMLGNEGVSIDDIRNLKSFLGFKPYSSRYKIVIVDDAHQMGEAAANAMLKVLEEPPAHSLIILISANPQALLPTIYSRCVEIKFAPHPRTELLKYLEQMDLNQAQAEFLADFSNGRLGLAYRLKEKNALQYIKKNL